MKRLLIALTVLALTGCGSTKGKYDGFTANVTNPWFPLRPGSVYIYRGVKDGKSARDVMTVTHRTKVIEGATCVAVRDRLYLNGKLEERTTDWYTQDPKGNVWYFGERTAELDEHGRVTDTSGSWQAGVHGGIPGIFMFAHPTEGRSARQEYLKGEAEDHFRVLKIGVPANVPYRSFGSAMLTKEWTPLEPGVIDHKLYARGIGTVLEVTAKGPQERNELVSFRQGS